MTPNTERLAFLGPRDPVFGYPLWYEDGTGQRLGLGVAVPADPMLPAVGDLPQPGAPLDLPANYPDEAFYFLADARMPIGGAGVAGEARLVLALEAAFGNAGVPDPDARIVFARIRVRIDDAIPGAEYVVTHPYGVTDPLPADERGRVRWTDDRGIANQDFERVLRDGWVAPFLRWTAGDEREPGELEAPQGYLGDGVTEHTVTGSPMGTNYFEVAGPGVGAGPAGASDVVRTNRFTVQGRTATRLGVEITAAHLSRTGEDVVLDVYARSAPDQALELSGTGVPRAAFSSHGRDYLVRVPVAGTEEPTVINTSDAGGVPTPVMATDQIVVTRCEYSLANGLLTIEARCSDDSIGSLEVKEFGSIPVAVATPIAVSAPPAIVVLTSAGGGRIEVPVRTVDGTSTTIPGVQADAGSDQRVLTGDEVTLDGRASRGPIDTWVWTQIAGETVSLQQPDAPTVVFTAPANAQTLRFAHEVTGDGATSRDEVSVVVMEKQTGSVVIDRAEYRTERLQYRVSGTATGSLPDQVVVTLNGQEIGRSPVDATGGWDVRRTLLGDETALRPRVGDVIAATSQNSAAAQAPIRVRA